MNLLTELAKIGGVGFSVVDNSFGRFAHANIRIVRDYDAGLTGTVPGESMVSIALGRGSYGSTYDWDKSATVWDLVEASTTVEAWGGPFRDEDDGPQGWVDVDRILAWARGED